MDEPELARAVMMWQAGVILALGCYIGWTWQRTKEDPIVRKWRVRRDEWKDT